MEIQSVLQKLFALADSTTSQGERETALKKAYELMAKHNIEYIKPEENAFQGAGFYYEGNVALYVEWVNGILVSFFNTRIIKNTRRFGNKKEIRYHYLCHNHNKDNVLYVRDFLFNTFHVLYEQYKKDLKKQGGRASRTTATSFYAGVYSGLYEKLRQAEQAVKQDPNACTALVVLDNQLETYRDELYPDAKSKSRRPNIKDAGSFSAGHVKGRQINIGNNNKQIH